MHCVNITHPDFKTLKEETKLHPAILAAKIAIWQEKNNTEDFPDVTQINPSNEVSYALKAVNILASPKAEEVFKKGEKNNWSLDKILTELAIPKEQKELILDLQDPAKARIFPKGYFEKDLREQIITDLLANYSYTVEINTATKVKVEDKTFEEDGFLDENGFIQSEQSSFTINGITYKKDLHNPDLMPFGYGRVINGVTEAISQYRYEEALEKYSKQDNVATPTQYYSNLTVNENFYKNNPDWEYKEMRITTPLITPSIKGHAKFAQDNDIGWFRAWYNKKTGEVHVLEIQSDLFQKGRDRSDLIIKEDYNATQSSSQGYGLFSLRNINYAKTRSGFFKNGIKITEEEYNKALEEHNNPITYGDKHVKENQFLQLLNKDNNWVTFFVKSIIQDTAKQTITEVQESDVEAKVKELEKDGLLEIDCKGKLKAEKGLQTNFTKGGKWKLIKDLKGYPTHKEGGIDLTIGKNGVSIKNGNTEFTAKHGLVIPKN